MSQQIPQDDILDSRSQVATRVGCSTRTVQRAERRGDLHAIKFNSRLIRYRRSEVLAWIEKSRIS